MEDQRPALHLDEQILAAPVHRAHALTADEPSQLRGYRPAQAGVPHHRAGDDAVLQMWRNTATGDFDFRKLGHRVLNLVQKGWERFLVPGREYT